MRSNDGIGVPLTLVDNSGRRIDAGPAEVTFGAVRLGRWHIHPVSGANDVFAGMAAYRIKINFDLDIDPGAPVVRWFEVGFELTEPGSTLVAALPEGATERRPAMSYALSRDLEFFPADNGAAPVHIPPTSGPVHVYGASGDSIRWVHIAATEGGIRPGGYSAWIVLLSPADRVEQKFRLTARFDPESVDGDDFQQAPKSTDFAVTLAEPTRVPIVAERHDGPAIGLPGPKPRVFICYAHEDEAHKEKVRDFADLLREHGVEPRIDKDQEGPRTEWDHWALGEIRCADFVAVIASPTCRAIGDGTFEGDGHPGIRSEFGAIRNLVQRHPAWSSHLLPIVLPGCSIDDIPMFLHPYTADHYCVEALIGTEIAPVLKTIRTTPPWAGWDRR